jgi:hypothetical protein
MIAVSLLRLRQPGVVLLLVGALLLNGCAPASRGASREGSSRRVSTPVVSPLTVTVVRPEQLFSINCLAVARPTFSRDSIDRTLAQDSVQPMIQSVADRVLSLKVIPAPTDVEHGGRRSRTPSAAKSDADAVLDTEVQTFRDRGGSALGGEPATVAFTMTIKNVSTGDEIWRAQYFYQQEALSDNWLKLGDRLGANGTGAGWASGRDLLERGVEAAVSDFGSRRESQFLVPASSSR